MELKNCILAVVILFFFSTHPAAENTRFNGAGNVQSDRRTVIPGDLEIYLGASGETYFFNTIGDQQRMESEDEDDGSTLSMDYSGRKYKMKYKFEPVYLVSIDGYLRWNFLYLDGVYKTDRIIKGGGEISHEDDALSKFTDNKRYSEVIRVGIGIFGLQTSYRSVDFNFGQASVVNVATDDVVSTSSINLKIEESEIMYKFGRARHIFAGYKYMTYALPRIAYMLEDTNGSEKHDEYVYVKETKPQMITSKYHLFGAGIDPVTISSQTGLGLVMGGSMYMGGGRAELEFESEDPEIPDETRNRFMFVFVPKFQAGLAYRLTDSFVESSVKIIYEGTFMLIARDESSRESGEDLGRKQYDFNASDYFHGLSLAVDVKF